VRVLSEARSTEAQDAADPYGTKEKPCAGDVGGVHANAGGIVTGNQE
jgi:hypothetical protein